MVKGKGKMDLQDAEVQKIMTLLCAHYCESDEEGVRNVVAECVGKLARSIDPENCWPVPSRNVTSSPPAHPRATVVVAIKYTIVERPQLFDSHPKSCISLVLLLL